MTAVVLVAALAVLLLMGRKVPAAPPPAAPAPRPPLGPTAQGGARTAAAAIASKLADVHAFDLQRRPKFKFKVFPDWNSDWKRRAEAHLAWVSEQVLAHADPRYHKAAGQLAQWVDGARRGYAKRPDDYIKALRGLLFVSFRLGWPVLSDADDARTEAVVQLATSGASAAYLARELRPHIEAPCPRGIYVIMFNIDQIQRAFGQGGLGPYAMRGKQACAAERKQGIARLDEAEARGDTGTLTKLVRGLVYRATEMHKFKMPKSSADMTAEQKLKQVEQFGADVLAALQKAT